MQALIFGKLPVGPAALYALAAAATVYAGAALAQTQGVTPPAVALPPGAMINVPVSTLFPGGSSTKPDIKVPGGDQSASAERGMQYFANFNCVGCHADNAGGGMGPALSNRAFVYGSDPADIFLTIYQGRPAGMPAWGDILPTSVIWDLVAYVKSISQAPVKGWGETISKTSPTIEQVPAEFQTSSTPWSFTEPFAKGQAPAGNASAPVTQ